MVRLASTLAIIVLCSSLLSTDAAGGESDDEDSNIGGNGGGTTFNVMSYGAKPGTKKESTQAFIKAWNAACNVNGKATVLVPAGVYLLGETIFQGPCKSLIPITVQVDGTLQAVPDASAYSGAGWISFSHVNGLVLTGGGTIDGQGNSLWKYNDCKTNPDCVHLAASLYMTKVSNAIVTSMHLINSMGFHIHITNSYLVRLQGLTISAPGDSPNTDGLHISKSNTVKVSKSIIQTGDDCISIGQGANNVTVNKITCGPGHGISVGSLGKEPKELDVTGLIVKNCTLRGTTNGIRIKTYAASDSSRASGFLFQDIVVDNVQNPIIIDQNYGTKSTKPSLVRISNIVYQNIRGTTASPVAVSLKCSSGVPCQNVHLHNIDLQATGNVRPTSVCSSANVGYSGVQNPPACKAGAAR
ncbi:Exopolygalacturonase [Sesamum alatum]|uniref:Exopolygalacturonase n=1 Tax=Sesamum alatum TaxID=300844 RepID=A0AAE1YPL1_9LAMI|nr:Exopolygalacturonase [Sesamum alatum]